jgi:hypothetical protein
MTKDELEKWLYDYDDVMSLIEGAIAKVDHDEEIDEVCFGDGIVVVYMTDNTHYSLTASEIVGNVLGIDLE